MTEKEAKLHWLKNRYGWLTKLFGPYVTDVTELPSGKLVITVTLSHLTPEEQSEIVMEHAHTMKESPLLQQEVYCMVFV